MPFSGRMEKAVITEAKHRLSSEELLKYRKSYRSCVVGLGTDKSLTIYFEDGTVASQEDVIGSTDLFIIWLLSDFIPFANSLGRPWILKNGDTSTTQNIQFKSEETELINEKGVNIFLYEPIFVVNEDMSWPWFPSNGAPVFLDLENIRRFRDARNIKGEINVFLCEYGLSAYLKKHNLFPDLEFQDFSTLLIHEALFSSNHQWIFFPSDQIEKKIISMNFRYEPSREMLTAYLRGNNFHNDCFMSFYHKHDPAEFRKRLPYDPSQLKNWPVIDQGLAVMQNEIPYVLDVKNPVLQNSIQGRFPDAHGANTRDYSRLRGDFLPQSFAYAYTESRPFSPCSEISEKTIHPILAMKPFIVFAAPGFLRNLRELGFKTFSDLWDESYDDIQDNCERYDAFLNVVGHICSQDIHTLREWAERLKPILAHNRLWMMRNIVPNEKSRIQKIFAAANKAKRGRKSWKNWTTSLMASLSK